MGSTETNAFARVVCERNRGTDSALGEDGGDVIVIPIAYDTAYDLAYEWGWYLGLM